jgi:hypothetical protein
MMNIYNCTIQSTISSMTDQKAKGVWTVEEGLCV